MQVKTRNLFSNLKCLCLEFLIWKILNFERKLKESPKTSDQTKNNHKWLLLSSVREKKTKPDYQMLTSFTH